MDASDEAGACEEPAERAIPVAVAAVGVGGVGAALTEITAIPVMALDRVSPNGLSSRMPLQMNWVDTEPSTSSDSDSDGRSSPERR